jgi:hypothetical protein
MKVGIVGGGGRVGSNAAFALQLIGAVSEVVLLDVNRDAAEGEALDLRHGAAYSQPVRFRAGDYPDLKRRAHGHHHRRLAPTPRRKPTGTHQPQCRAVPRDSGQL